ncbi:MAG: hypothetical protein II937_09595 [Bacteroidales bacterium]|nr:hypothetical protein [Bacteroidales bacterium]
MTNEEKAKGIAEKTHTVWRDDEDEEISSQDDCYEAAMQMAKYKDVVIKNQEQMIFACKSDIRRLQIANRNLCSELRNQAKKIRKFKAEKDNDLKNQEQSLLLTLYSILDNLAIEGEARLKAINEFKMNNHGNIRQIPRN